MFLCQSQCPNLFPPLPLGVIPQFVPETPCESFQSLGILWLSLSPEKLSPFLLWMSYSQKPEGVVVMGHTI